MFHPRKYWPYHFLEFSCWTYENNEGDILSFFAARSFKQSSDHPSQKFSLRQWSKGHTVFSYHTNHLTSPNPCPRLRKTPNIPMLMAHFDSLDRPANNHSGSINHENSVGLEVCSSPVKYLTGVKRIYERGYITYDVCIIPTHIHRFTFPVVNLRNFKHEICASRLCIRNV